MNDGRKKKSQKHQNKTAFKIQFDPVALQIHKKVSFRGLCKRCADQLQWKIQYNKYKKMTQLGKCNFCLQKNVNRSYMRACQGCSKERTVCPKCLESETEEQTETRLNEAEQKKQDQESEKRMNDFLKTLKERSRRTVKRLQEKETITWNNQLQTFVDQEGKTLNLQFRQGYGDSKYNDSDDEDDLDMEDDDEDMSDVNSEGQIKAKVKKVQTGKEQQPLKVQQVCEEQTNNNEDWSDEDQQLDTSAKNSKAKVSSVGKK